MTQFPYAEKPQECYRCNEDPKSAGFESVRKASILVGLIYQREPLKGTRLVRGNEILPSATAWTDLETSMLSNMKSEKGKYHPISLTHGNLTNKTMSKGERE